MLSAIAALYSRSSVEEGYGADLCKERAVRRSFCQHSAAVVGAELEVAGDELAVLEGQLQRVAAQNEALRSSNDALRLRRGEDSRKKSLLTRLSAPQNTPHHRSTPRPISMGIRSHLASPTRPALQRTSFPSFRDAKIESEVADLEDELSMVTSTTEEKRKEWEQRLGAQRKRFEAEFAEILKGVENMNTAVAEQVDVSVMIQRKVHEHRCRGLQSEERLEVERAGLVEEIKKVAGVLEAERISRASEMQAVISDVKREVKTDLKRLRAERQDTLKKTKALEKQAEMERAEYGLFFFFMQDEFF